MLCFRYQYISLSLWCIALSLFVVIVCVVDLKVYPVSKPVSLSVSPRMILLFSCVSIPPVVSTIHAPLSWSVFFFLRALSFLTLCCLFSPHDRSSSLPAWLTASPPRSALLSLEPDHCVSILNVKPPRIIRNLFRQCKFKREGPQEGKRGSVPMAIPPSHVFIHAVCDRPTIYLTSLPEGTHAEGERPTPGPHVAKWQFLYQVLKQ